MDGWLDFQADGAAQRQARSQAAAGDKRTRSHDIGDIHNINLGGGQVQQNSVISDTQFVIRKKEGKVAL